MSKKEVILGIVWIGAALLSVVMCYKVYVMDKNYEVVTLTSCDPALEVCYVLECDQSTDTYNEDICQTIGDGEVKHFSFIKKKMNHITTCDSREEECPGLRCEKGEEGCQLLVCNDENLREYGDKSMRCTERVALPEPPKMPESSKPQELAPPEETTLPVESALPVDNLPTDRQTIQPAPPVESPIPSTPTENPVPSDQPSVDQAEPSHNLPI